MKYILLILFFLASCEKKHQDIMSGVAENYVKIILELGLYDKDMVDAYYGPEEWKLSIKKEDKLPKEKLLNNIKSAQTKLREIKAENLTEIEKLRFRFLQKQFNAIKFRIHFLTGEKVSFDMESEIVYDAISPKHPEEYYKNLIHDLDKLLPGKGRIDERLTAYKKNFIIAPGKLDTVFKTAIYEAKKRTKKYINLPETEEFVLQYVKNKAWSGYNWYQGNGKSLIQINIDFPIYIERAIDLACHEGYPGHHVYNSLLEKHLFRTNQWMEFSIYPLFSPQSLIAEGSANYGIDVAFNPKERMDFEKNVLFPLAGLDKSTADKYYNVLSIVGKLSYAGNEAARNYLDGKMTKDKAIDWLQKYALYSPEKAKQRLDFIVKYRSYVINYNLGKDLIKSYVENKITDKTSEAEKWKIFQEDILSRPMTASSLKEKIQ